MTVNDVQRILEQWAPKEIAWEKDNVGLQVGSPGTTVRGIQVCLDVNEPIIQEARKRKANLIISHHPLLFRPLRSVNLHDQNARCIEQLLRSRITLFSAHTNLDFCRGGTSFALAEKLGLVNVDFLQKSYRTRKKIVTFVPVTHVDRVASAMSNVGAGRIGNYEHCSFKSHGTGSFMGNASSHPAIGSRETLEHVQEVRLEMVADQVNIQQVVRALSDAHPYEEAAYDVYPLDNVSDDFGMGVIGTLQTPMRPQQFIAHVKRVLKTKSLRCTSSTRRSIRRIAVCGGSGSDLADEAIRHGADAFVTADVKYHSFHDFTERILLIDAGHYETERPVVDTVVAKLRKKLKEMGERVPVFAAATRTNPVVYH